LRGWAFGLVILASVGCGSAESDSDVTVPDAGHEADAGSPADARPMKLPSDATPIDSGGVPTPDAGAAVRFVGRVDRSDPAGPRFTWSGSAVLARFTGTSVGVRLRDNGNRFHVILDGMPLTTLATMGSQQLYPLASNLSSGPHELALYRRTEAFVGETQFLGLALDPTGTLLPPPPPATRRIEFVGDSITCGYGIEGANMSCPFTPDTENQFLTAGAIAARTLGAETITVAYSGKGMYRNLMGDMNETVPMLYDRVLVDRANLRWDFASWIPDAVVINLGTNDFGLGDPGTGFRDAYEAFVRRVRGNYPVAHILCTFGPMMSAEQVTKARGYIDAMIATLGDSRVTYFDYPTQDGSRGYGCDWHPSVGTNQQMADLLTAELRRLLGW
jgi:lysophospholipase L1-like esterase